MPNKPRYPQNSLVIRDYEKFENYISKFAEGHLNLLILISSAGTGKSHSVRRKIGEAALWIEGSASAFGMYQALYRNRHLPVVIDDVDELFRDRSCVRLLKCLCQTDPVKRVGWYTNATKAGSGIPVEFETTSQTIIIANEWETINHNVGAVQDRGHLIFFEPTLEAMHRKVAEWFWDQEIYDFVGENLFLFPKLSVRNYVNASELKNAGLDWMDVFFAECECEITLNLARVLGDPSLNTEPERVKAFADVGGGGRTTYYKYKKKLLALARSKIEPIEGIQVQGRKPKRPSKLHVLAQVPA